MPNFRYTAVSPAGEMLQGIMDATDEQAVVRALQGQGNIPMRAEPALEGTGALRRLLQTSVIGKRGLSRQDVADSCVNSR